MTSREQQLITAVFDRGHDRRGKDTVVGIGDDAAVTRVAAGSELVSAIDTIVDGVHFPPQLTPAQIGYRALAVNLSDLAAMGAQPRWALLSLCCPHPEADWYRAFARGFFELADTTGIELIGGDLVRGPLSVTVTVLGEVPAGAATRRSGACEGDIVFVTGRPGAAAAGLAALLARASPGNDPAGCEDLIAAFTAPVPRIDEGLALRGLASAAIDLSDGLVGDARQLAAASGAAIRIDTRALARAAAGGVIEQALRGGDDYELLFTVPASRRDELQRVAQDWSCPVTEVGVVGAGSGVTAPGYDLLSIGGYDHFRQ